MQIVIDIPDPPSKQKIIDIPVHFCGGQVVDVGGYGFEERKTGKWVHAKVGKLFPSNDFKCSLCGNFLDFHGVNAGRGDANYCPNCGANMEVDE